jgi:hypothetical protein
MTPSTPGADSKRARHSTIWRRPVGESSGSGKRKRKNPVPLLEKDGSVKRLYAMLFGGENAAYEKVVKPALLFLRRTGLDPKVTKEFEATPFEFVFGNGVYDSFCRVVRDAFQEDKERIREFLEAHCPDIANTNEQIREIDLIEGDYDQLWNHRLMRPFTGKEWQSILDAYQWLLCGTRKFYEAGQKFPGSFREFPPPKKSLLTAEGPCGNTSRVIMWQLGAQLANLGISQDTGKFAQLTDGESITDWVNDVLSLQGRVYHKSCFECNHIKPSVRFMTWGDAVEFVAREIYEVGVWRAWRPLFMLSPWLFGGDGIKFMGIYAEYKLRGFKQHLTLQKESLCAFYKLGGGDVENSSYKESFNRALASVVTGSKGFAQNWATGSTLHLGNPVASIGLPPFFVDTTHQFLDVLSVQQANRKFNRICEIVNLLHAVGDLLYKVSLERLLEMDMNSEDTDHFWEEVRGKAERFLQAVFLSLHSVGIQRELPHMEDLEETIRDCFKSYWVDEHERKWFLMPEELPFWFREKLHTSYSGGIWEDNLRTIYFEGTVQEVLEYSSLQHAIVPGVKTFCENIVFKVVYPFLQTLLKQYFVMRDAYYKMFEEVWDMGGKKNQQTWQEKIEYWRHGLNK